MNQQTDNMPAAVSAPIEVSSLNLVELYQQGKEGANLLKGIRKSFTDAVRACYLDESEGWHKIVDFRKHYTKDNGYTATQRNTASNKLREILKRVSLKHSENKRIATVKEVNGSFAVVVADFVPPSEPTREERFSKLLGEVDAFTLGLSDDDCYKYAERIRDHILTGLQSAQAEGVAQAA
jgi:hypothetical protein